MYHAVCKLILTVTAHFILFWYVQSSAQQALMGTINTSMQAVQKAQIDLGEVDNLPPLGQDMVLYTHAFLLHKMFIYSSENSRTMCLIWWNVFLWFVFRLPRCGSRTRWMNPNMRSTLKSMPSLQERHQLWISQLVSGSSMTQQNIILLFYSVELISVK